MNRRNLLKALAAMAPAGALAAKTTAAATPRRAAKLPAAKPIKANSASFIVNGTEIAHTLTDISYHTEADHTEHQGPKGVAQRLVQVSGMWSEAVDNFWEDLKYPRPVAVVYRPKGAGGPCCAGAGVLLWYRMDAHPSYAITFAVTLRMDTWVVTAEG